MASDGPGEPVAVAAVDPPAEPEPPVHDSRTESSAVNVERQRVFTGGVNKLAATVGRVVDRIDEYVAR